MLEVRAKDIRNIAIIGHGSEGKTTLTEAMLFAAGAIDRQGRVEDGSTITDHDPEEIKRAISISTALAPIEYQGVKVNLMDVPGYFDFAGEMMGPLRVCDAAVIVMSATSSITVGAEKAWDACVKAKLPRMIVINQMDRENADFGKLVELLKDTYGAAIAPIRIPLIQNGTYAGFVCILEGQAYEGVGKNEKKVSIPNVAVDDVAIAREMIMEAAAGANEALMEKYFEEGTLSHEETTKGLRQGILEGTIVPVVCTSALNGVGVLKLLSTLIDLMPSPADKKPVVGLSPKTGDLEERPCEDSAPFCAQVFKTLADPFVGKLSLVKVLSGTLTSDMTLLNPNVEKNEKAGTLYHMRGKKQTVIEKLHAGDIGALAKLQYTATGHTLCDPAHPIKLDAIKFPAPCISKAVYASKSGEEDKLFSGLARLMEEDPTLTTEKNTQTTETLLSGLGELHIEVVAKKLKSKFGVDAILQDPKIPYRETIRKTVKVNGRHKKQSGGHGQFGDVWIEFAPLTNGEEFEFVDKVVGGAVPRSFIPAVEKGLRENLGRGTLAGFPIVGLQATLYDGSYHAVDSSEMAFKTAARMALRKGCTEASPALMEPIYLVEVTIPDDYMGDVIGDMNRRRGRILGMDQVDGLQQVTAEAPLSELFKYATDLRSITQARGTFTMQFARYEDVPPLEAKKIIESHKQEEEDE